MSTPQIYDTTDRFRFDGWASPANTVTREEGKDLIDLVQAGHRIYADGPRRVGKTTLVINTLDARNIPILRLDLEGVNSNEALLNRISSQARGFVAKYPAVAKRLNGSESISAEIGTQLGIFSAKVNSGRERPAIGVERTLDGLLAAIVEVARAAKACIFVDEFQAVKGDKMENAGEVLGSFASASDPSNTKSDICFVFAGSNRNMMHKIFSGTESVFFQRTRNLPIGVIPQETIIPFLNKRLGATMPVEVSQEAFRWTEGIPGDLQRLYSALRREIGKNRTVTMEDLIEAKRRVVEDLGRSYALTLQTLPADQLRLLDSITKQDVRQLSALTPEGLGLGKIEFQTALEGLLKLGLIHLAGSGRTRRLERPEPIMFHYLSAHPAYEHSLSYAPPENIAEAPPVMRRFRTRIS